MLDWDVVEPAIALLSATIGMVLEDHVEEAVTSLPKGCEERCAHFRQLGRAGHDVTTLAAAAEVLLRRAADPK